MTNLDPNWSRIVSSDFIDSPYHDDHYVEEGELCSMAPKNGTTTFHLNCTASSSPPATKVKNASIVTAIGTNLKWVARGVDAEASVEQSQTWRRNVAQHDGWEPAQWGVGWKKIRIK